jgi:hypothetical protein
MVPLQAQQTLPMQNFAPQQMQEAGRAVQQLGGVVSDYAMRVQNEVDSANIKRHDNILADEIERIMRDPKSGYLNQVGKVAVDNRQVAFDALAKKQKDIEKGLQNPLQRQIWGENAQKRIRQATSDANEHYTKQAKVWEIGESQVRAGNFVRDMQRTALRTDSEGIKEYDDAKRWLKGEADRISELSGHPIGSAQYNETRLQATTNAHSSIIRGMADQNPQKAQEHLDAASAAGEIAPEVAADLKKLVQGATEDDMAQQLAMMPQMAKASLQEKVEYINSLYSGKHISVGVRDKAIHRVIDAKQIENIGRAEDESAMQGEWQQWMMNHPLQHPRTGPAHLTKWANETGGWDWIINFSKTKSVVTDQEVFSSLMRDYQRNPTQFAAGSDPVLLAKLRTRLEPDDLNYIMALRSQVRGNASQKDIGILTEAEVVNNAAKDLGYMDYSGNIKSQSSFNDYRNLRMQTHAAVVASGDGSLASVSKIVKTIVADKVHISDYGFDSEMRLIDVPAGTDPTTIYVPTEVGEMYLNQIPPEEVAMADDFLQGRGEIVTSAAIANTYAGRVKMNEEHIRKHGVPMPGFFPILPKDSGRRFPLGPPSTEDQINQSIQDSIRDAIADEESFGWYGGKR